MPQDTFVRIVRTLRSLGVEHLGLFYINEPFATHGLTDAVRIAKQRFGFPHVFVTTNGLAATPDRVRACIEAGLDSLKFAVNFHSSPQLAAHTASGPDAHATILANIATARQVRDDVFERTGHRCRLAASGLAYGAQQADRSAAVFATIGQHVDEHYWLPFFGRSDWAPADVRPAGRIRPALLRKPTPCWTLFNEAHICADGHLSACCLDPSPRFRMGDLDRMPFTEAWHAPAFRQLREAHLRNELTGTVCADCIAYE